MHLLGVVVSLEKTFLRREDAKQMDRQPIYPDFHFLEKVEANGPFNVEACFHCCKCSSGCQVSFAMDLLPDEVIRMVSLGQREVVLSCRTIWVCAACEICTTRCPNEVKIAELFDFLKEMALSENAPISMPHIQVLHQTFLSNIGRWGRIFEGGLIPMYVLQSGQMAKKLRKGDWWDDLRLGLQLMIKGRLPLFPKMIRGRKDIRSLLAPAKKVRNRI